MSLSIAGNKSNNLEKFYDSSYNIKNFHSIPLYSGLNSKCSFCKESVFDRPFTVTIEWIDTKQNEVITGICKSCINLINNAAKNGDSKQFEAYIQNQAW